MARRQDDTSRHDFPNADESGTTQRASDRTARPGRDDHTELDDRHAVGTPGGGTEIGGLAGSNFGHGDPADEEDLHEAMANGENEPEAEDDENAYGGFTGGAVGGTPAQGRSKGGRTGGGIAPGRSHRGDSTLGSDPEHPSE